jgi:hypothetical protein
MRGGLQIVNQYASQGLAKEVAVLVPHEAAGEQHECLEVGQQSFSWVSRGHVAWFAETVAKLIVRCHRSYKYAVLGWLTFTACTPSSVGQRDGVLANGADTNTAQGPGSADERATLKQLAEKDLFGLAYYLRPVSQRGEPDEVATKLWQNAFTRFMEMHEEWISRRQPDLIPFSKAREFRAGAVCVDDPNLTGNMSFFAYTFDAYVSAWGLAGDQSSQEDADKSALAECSSARGKYGHEGCVCRVIARAGKIVQKPSEWTATIEPLQLQLDKENTERLLSSEILRPLDAVLADAVSSSTTVKGQPVLDIRLQAAKPLELGYPDEQQDYASACHDRISYSLYRATEAERVKVATELGAVERGRMYGCYRISVDTTKNPRNNPHRPSERQCRYLDFVDLTKEAASLQEMLPPNWRELPQLRTMSGLWVESVARVDEDGTPVLKRPLARPIAVQDAEGLLIAVEITAPEPNGGCYVAKPFQGKVFDFTGCSSVDECRSHAAAALLSNLRARLANNPFGAEWVADEALPPGEFRLKREKLPSLVLGGAYYEWAKYAILTWTAESADPFGSLYGRSTFRGLNSGGTFMFLRLEHIYTISKHKLGTYREPNEREVESYVLALRDLVPTTLKQTCDSLSGTLNEQVCALH